jgi:hypothetical protein
MFVMTDAQVIRALRTFYEGLFPKVCSNCGRRYATLREYIEATQRLWPSLDYDIEMGNLKTPKPIGGLAMANCVCGTTMALSTKHMPIGQTHLLLEWIRIESERRAWSPTQMLDYLRDEVRKDVLAEAPREESPVLRKGSMPGHSPDPKAASGTSPAGEESRHP